MKKYSVDVEYKSGESRYTTGKAVDYMLAEVDDIELYAETEPGEGETDSYEALKAEILAQAQENGITTENLIFWYD